MKQTLLFILLTAIYLFGVEPEGVSDAFLEINSNPSGAIVYINGIQIGETPVSLAYPSGDYLGDYPIKLTKENFEDLKDTISISLQGANKTYKLTDKRATLTINTHENAKIYINGVCVENYKNIKLLPQIVSIKVVMDKSKILEEKILLGKQENKILEMYPETSTGTIQIAVIPSDAKVELWECRKSKFSNIGSMIFKDIPFGNYNLKVSKEGYRTKTEKLQLTGGVVLRKSIKLKEVIGDYVFVQGNGTIEDFYIGKYEITQAQWEKVMGSNPAKNYGVGDKYPVYNVSYNDVLEYCDKLSDIENLEHGYRLPTEEEWEYAARGGKKSQGYKYSGSNKIGDVAWYIKTSRRKVHLVRSKQPNELGIYNMSGNVKEWCESDDTSSSKIGKQSVRGGGWSSKTKHCQIVNRDLIKPTFKDPRLGFRVVFR